MPPHSNSELPKTNLPEPRWSIVLALLAAGALYLALPEPLSVGPHWLLLVIVLALLVPTWLTQHRDPPLINMALGHTLSGVITGFMLWSLVMLIRGLFAHRETPAVTLRSGALLWLTNVLVFASWYWRLDAGGPHGRAKRLGHRADAFLFPQMTLEGGEAKEKSGMPWSPKFIDYLFLAFNTSTALSPTDTPVLSRWAKALLMVQSLISLSITLVLVGRAVNIM